MKPILGKKSTGKKVAFFAVSSDGTITVRKPNDYVSAMIGLAGGIYSLGNYTDEEKKCTFHDENADGRFLFCGG